MSSSAQTPQSLPIIDIINTGNAAKAISEAFASSGFFYATGLGIPKSTIDGIRLRQREFFAMPVEDKQSIAIDANNRGYLAEGAARMHGAKNTDQKEVFFWGSDHGADHPDRLAGVPMCGPNQWPRMMPELQTAVSEYASNVTRIGNQILKAIAVALGAPEDFFVPFYGASMTRGQLIAYPPTTTDDDQFGVAPHTDFGCITLLLQETPGLEALVGDHWIPVPPVEDTLVINVGDLLERWTGGRVPSTRHRVVNRNKGARYSIAMFHDPDPLASIDPHVLQKAITADTTASSSTSPLYEPIGAADYILSRNRGAFSHFKEDRNVS